MQTISHRTVQHGDAEPRPCRNTLSHVRVILTALSGYAVLEDVQVGAMRVITLRRIDADYQHHMVTLREWTAEPADPREN